MRDFLVVLLQAPSDFAGLNADHRVLSGGISGRTLKYLRSNGALLQPVGMAVKLAQNHVANELLAAVGAPEVPAGQDAVQFLKNFQALR
jgi:hypothetical protein